MASGDTVDVESKMFVATTKSENFTNHPIMFLKPKPTFSPNEDVVVKIDTLLYAILCVSCLSFLVLIFIVLWFYLKRLNVSKSQNLSPNKLSKSTSITGLESYTQNQSLQDFRSDALSLEESNFDGGHHVKMRNRKKDAIELKNLKTENQSNNESSDLISPLMEGSMWTESPVNRDDSLSLMSNINSASSGKLIIEKTSRNSLDLKAPLSNNSSGDIVSSFPVDGNGHPRAWFVPLDEMCQSSVRHSTVNPTSSLVYKCFNKEGEQHKATISKSESSYAQLEGLSFDSIASDKHLMKNTKWNCKESRPVVYVENMMNKN